MSPLQLRACQAMGSNYLVCLRASCVLVFQVEEAFATLEAWQGVAHGLPALVDRLRALETLHLASASFAQRLEQVGEVLWT